MVVTFTPALSKRILLDVCQPARAVLAQFEVYLVDGAR